MGAARGIDEYRSFNDFFTRELDAALRKKRIDLAVHSLKDLPVEDSAGLTVVAVPERAPPMGTIKLTPGRGADPGGICVPNPVYSNGEVRHDLFC